MNYPAQATNSFIGVDIYSPTLRAALVKGDGSVLERRESSLDKDASVSPQVARLVIELRDAAGAAPVSGLGLSVPGLVDLQTDRVVISSDLPAVLRGDLGVELQQATGLPTLLVNDANAAAYGEYMVGAGRGSRHMFYVTIGSGVGGALILDGKLWLGAAGFAGEFGHITIDPEGIECVCGNRGCLETVAAAPNIVRRTHERLNPDST